MHNGLSDIMRATGFAGIFSFLTLSWYYTMIIVPYNVWYSLMLFVIDFLFSLFLARPPTNAADPQSTRQPVNSIISLPEYASQTFRLQTGCSSNHLISYRSGWCETTEIEDQSGGYHCWGETGQKRHPLSKDH